VSKPLAITSPGTDADRERLAPREAERSDRRCDSCGYGIAAERTPERCPMCGTGAWVEQARRPLEP
jgi:hypothetical protein